VLGIAAELLNQNAKRCLKKVAKQFTNTSKAKTATAAGCAWERLFLRAVHKNEKREEHRADPPNAPQRGEQLDFHYSSILPTRKQEFFSKKLTYYTNIKEKQEKFAMQKMTPQTVHPAVEIKRNKNNIPAF
jgi:hypothetical protein